MDTQEIEFPCEYPIKVICTNDSAVKDAVAGIVQKYAPDFDSQSVVVQPSRNGNFISLRVTFTATGREQLDSMHQDITSLDQVKMVI